MPFLLKNIEWSRNLGWLAKSQSVTYLPKSGKDKKVRCCKCDISLENVLSLVFHL
jgi:hypothetical protein